MPIASLIPLMFCVGVISYHDSGWGRFISTAKECPDVLGMVQIGKSTISIGKKNKSTHKL